MSSLDSREQLQLHLTLISAHGLLAADKNGASDPCAATRDECGTGSV